MSRDGWRKRAAEGDGWGGRGGYMAAKVFKLDEQFRQEAPREKQKEGASSEIFRGVAIYVNGYTDPTADELRRLMMLHGGQFHVYYSRSKTTHIIATNLPNIKIQELRTEKVVRPEWITDSIKAGRLLSCLQYQLYRPRALCFPGTWAPPGQESAGPSHTPNHACHARRELDHAHQDGSFRLNGSMRNCVDRTGGPKMNGVHEGASDYPEGPLTNGHAHPANGALKPLDLALHPGRDALGKPLPPPSDCPQTPPAQDGRPMVQPRPLQSPPAPNPAPHHKPCSSSSASPAPALLPSANQKAAAIAKPCPQTPPPQSPGSEKPLPLCGRVRLNGTHYASPATPTAGPAPPDSPGKHVAPPTPASAISEYYSHSRLHHISTWRNEFSEFVNSLQQRRRAKGGAVFPGKERLRRQRPAHDAGLSGPAGPQNRQACILHVDMDCFFASVGIRHRPDLKGKPVAVTSNRGPGTVALRPGANPQMEVLYYQRRREGKADPDSFSSPESPDAPGNGVDPALAALSMAEIASCSYEARQTGVRNGMFFGQAKRLCPALQAVPYDFQAYKEVALVLYETLASYTHEIEALSCDEVLVDASGLLAELGVAPDELASAIRTDVRERTGCSASVGMGSNILLARMATRKAKPNGQYYLKPEEVDDFIREQPVTSLPGVGRSMGCKLTSLGVRTCGELQQLSLSRLQKEFGPRTGQTLFRFCRGLDDRPVRSEKERKSVSAEMNYGIRFTQVSEAESFLISLSQEVQGRLQAAGLQGRRLNLKIMVRKPGAPVESAKYGGHGICDNLARSVTLEQPTDSVELIGAEVLKLFHSMKLNAADVRGVGLQVHQLVGSRPALPDQPRPRSIRDLLLAQRSAHSAAMAPPTTPERVPPVTPPPSGSSNQSRCTPARAPPPTSACSALSSPTTEPVPSTSKGEPPPRYNGGLHTPSQAQARLNCSIEVPSPSQVDRSVLEALPPEIREQVERSWSRGRALTPPPPLTPPPAPPPSPPAQPAGTLILQIPEQAGGAGIVLALPDFSQVDPEVFAALPPELQEELRSAYMRKAGAHPQSTMAPKNALLQLRAPGFDQLKRRHKRKNLSPAKKGPSPMKARLPGNSPAKSSPAKSSPAKLHPLVLKYEDTPTDALKRENGPSTSSLKPDVPQHPSKLAPTPQPALAGASELTDIRTLLREWVTTITEPMEEDILQVVKYCTALAEGRDLEKLDLVIKYMKRLMQQSVESVWSMAFDFILDNVQVVLQQTYGSTLKIT
ncbi:DNA repair protein REV1 [Anguilla anguilla]|uniref:DNA repair protein REV1 n=1 Tax=Anguilla anguilla TaxID=7936 RepID=UPI0015A898F1|nr:DNA repair protein REV1 [Anguilla anguilla]